MEILKKISKKNLLKLVIEINTKKSYYRLFLKNMTKNV